MGKTTDTKPDTNMQKELLLALVHLQNAQGILVNVKAKGYGTRFLSVVHTDVEKVAVLLQSEIDIRHKDKHYGTPEESDLPPMDVETAKKIIALAIKTLPVLPENMEPTEPPKMEKPASLDQGAVREWIDHEITRTGQVYVSPEDMQRAFKSPGQPETEGYRAVWHSDHKYWAVSKKG